MSIKFQCSGCRQWYEVPDRAAGHVVTCPSCKNKIEVPLTDEYADPAPMILDDDEADNDEFAESVTDPGLPSAEFVGAVPQINTETAPAQVKAAPAAMVFEDEATERAIQLSRPAIMNYIYAGVIVVGVLVIGVIVAIQKARQPNPLPSQVTRTLAASPDALAWLGERQTGHIYSFQLPKNFVPAAEQPSVNGLPPKTVAHAWEAIPGGNDEGSRFMVWVIPKSLDLREQLASLNNLKGRLGYDTAVEERSDFFKLGKDIVGVRGTLDGSSYDISRRGVVYLLAHKGQTIMIVGVAVGPTSRQGQGVLDAAVRTIEGAASAKSKS